VTLGRRARIMLADDHEMVREGLRALIGSAPDLQVVSEAGDGKEAVERVMGDRIDVAVLDVTMPRLTGLQAAREILKRNPDIRVLMLSMHHNEQFFFESIRVGASGYVLKSAAGDDLVDACRKVLRGEPFIYPPAMKLLMRSYLEQARGGGNPESDLLTPREIQVVKLIAEGLNNAQIGKELVIAENTVERHRENVLGKLGMHDRVELTRYAIRRNLIDP
jgi:DNA-binding NarL/FixJ family response regulator